MVFHPVLPYTDTPCERGISTNMLRELLGLADRNFGYRRLHRFPVFATVGCAATLVHFSVLTILVEICRLPWPTVASAVGSLFGISTAYLGNYHWTFRRTESHRQFMLRFFITYLFTMTVHTFIVFLDINALGFSYVTAFVVATMASTIMNFGLNKYFVFERKFSPVSSLPATDHESAIS